MVYVESLGKRLCFDTDILIDYLRKPSEAVGLLMKKVYEKKVQGCTTAVNAFEIWLGVHLAPKPKELIEETEEFLSHFEIVDFSYEASAEAGLVMAMLRKRGEVIEIRDLFVGSISKASEMHLITRNVKHYRRIPKLIVTTPEEALRT